MPDFQHESGNPGDQSDMVPGQTQEEDEIAERIMHSVKADRDGRQKWMTEARKCHYYQSGHQWEEEDLQILKDQNRPPITFNRINPLVALVTGSEIHNRQDVRFLPRHPEDGLDKAGFADLATDAVRFVLDNCDGDDERSIAFEDMLCTGVGTMQIRMDYEDDLEGEVKVDRVPFTEAWWDQQARKQNLTDARWVYRRRFIPRDQIEEKYPDKVIALADSVYDFDPMDGAEAPLVVHHTTPELYKPDGTRFEPSTPGFKPKDFLLVTEYQWYEMEKFYRYADPQPNDENHLAEMPEEDFNKLKRRIATLNEGKPEEEHQQVPKAVKQAKRVYKYAIATGPVILEYGDLPVQNEGFTIRFMTYRWDEKDKTWYGLVRSLIDPQQGANKWFSQALHIFNISPKGLLLYETGAFVNPGVVESRWSSPGGTLQMKEGMLDKYHVEPPPALSEAAFQLTQFAIQSFTAVTGINVELMGLSEGDQSSVTMRQRQMQGMTVLAPAFNALTKYRKGEAMLILAFVREFLADGRVIRVGGTYDSKALPLLKDRLSVRYDVMIDENPKNPNAKIEVWTALQNSGILPVMVKTGKFPSELLDFAPLPAVVAARIKEKLDKEAQQPPQFSAKGSGKFPPDPKMVAAEIELTKAKVAETMAKAKALDQNSSYETALQGLQSKPGEEQAVLQGQQQLDQGQQKMQQEAQRHQQQMTIAAQKHQMDMMSMRRKMMAGALQPNKQLLSPE